MKNIIYILISLLFTTSALAFDSDKTAAKLINLFEADILEDYIISYETPQYLLSYENLDGTYIHLFKATITFPVYGNGSFMVSGQEEATEPAVGSEVECRYIKFSEIDDDFEYAGPCHLDIEDVIGEDLIDEL